MRLYSRLLILVSAAASLTACSSSAPAGAPASMAPASEVFQTGTVGQAVIIRPSVRVLDAEQQPARGATVEWTVVDGGGTIGGATSTTDADGIATVSSWTLGTAAGSNILRASAAGGTITGVVFEVEGHAANATAMVIHAGNGQNALVGQTLPVSPAVKVVDQYGNGVAQVQVFFSVAAGGGVLQGEAPSTNEQGIATILSWRLGINTGPNALSVTSLGLQPVQIVAVAGLSPKCSSTTAYSLFTVAPGVLDESDCLFPDAFYYDFFAVDVPATQSIRFAVQSTAMDSWLELRDANGNLLAENDDVAEGVLNSAITIIAAPGTMLALASTAVQLQLGTYTLSSAADDGLATNCELLFATRGVTVAQTLTASDCFNAGGPFYSDEFAIRLLGGVPVTVTMTSATFDTHLQLYGSAVGLPPVAENDNISLTDTNSQLTYTPTAPGYYFISASSFLTEDTGPYTLSISAGTPAADFAESIHAIPLARFARTLDAELIRRGAIRRR